jgi:hypothetical protein
MGVAGGETAIRCWKAKIILNREEQFLHGFVEAPADEMRAAYDKERCADADAGTKAHCGFEGHHTILVSHQIHNNTA